VLELPGVLLHALQPGPGRRSVAHRGIDAERNANKGNRDRLVPLPEATLSVLRAFWAAHRHPRRLFPNRAGAAQATSALDRGGVQRTLACVVQALGLEPCIVEFGGHGKA
jgi:integrase